MDIDRYHRQVLLPQIGAAGQARLAAARVLLIGCGALGSVVAEQLVRAGAGFLRVADRDIVEWTNLQRQVLFDEADARDGLPKAVAAQRRLSRINSTVTIESAVTDVHSGNIESLASGVGLVLDGTDNVETRYLINDVSIKHGIPWVYAGCVGTEGRVMPILPGRGPCLRCVFPEPPAGAELATCDTAGVLGPVAAAVASMQAVAALKLLSGNESDVRPELWSADLWAGRMRSSAVERNPNCPACAKRQFSFLSLPAAQSTKLCGRRSVQVHPAQANTRLDLNAAAQKLSGVGEVEQTPYLVRCRLRGGVPVELTLFPDGRMIVSGTTDSGNAKSLYARYVGA